nr:hypothetical protein [Rhizobium album]
MLRGNEIQPPVLYGDMGGINGTVKHFGDAFDMHFAFHVFRPCGLCFEKAFYFRNCLETPAGIAFERIGNDCCIWLVAHEKFSMPGNTLVTVSERWIKYPIAVHHAGAHPVHGLLAILLALVLRDRGKQVLNKDGIGILAELDGRTFELAASIGNRGAKLQMRFQPTGQPAYVVNQYDAALCPVLLQEIEHVDHAGA